MEDFKSIFVALDRTRKLFHKINKGYGVLEDAVNLFFEQMALIREVVTKEDEERYSIEVVLVASRRIIASLALLESGLPQEAHMLLRNAIELMLIFIDITHNKQSLEKWKKTESEDLINSQHKDWYFSKSKVCIRIEEDTDKLYPPEERKLAIGDPETDTWSLSKEWKKISNQSLHAYSQAQLRPLFKEGEFQFLGLKKRRKYNEDFFIYAQIFFNLTFLLMGIPKYARLVHESFALKTSLNSFKTHYLSLKREMGGEC